MVCPKRITRNIIYSSNTIYNKFNRRYEYHPSLNINCSFYVLFLFKIVYDTIGSERVLRLGSNGNWIRFMLLLWLLLLLLILPILIPPSFLK
jgi:hypothetical protein